MTAILCPTPMLQFFDSSGNPLSGGKLFTYAAGTTTKTATFTDQTGGVQNANPVIMNSRGEPTTGGIWLAAGTAYKFVLSPSTDTDPPTNPIWTVDQVIGIATSNPTFATIADALAGTSTTLFMNPLDTANAIQQGFNYAPDTGAASAYAGTFAPVVAARVSGETLFLRIANNSTGASATVNVGLGADVIKKVTPVGLKPIMAGELVTPTVQPFTWSTTDNLWQVGHTLPAPTWSLPLAKTAGYTVTAADRNRIIRFSGLAADATVALPAAANSEGFEVTLVNADTGINPAFAVIIDPSGAETIDGFTTRKFFYGKRITIACDGTAWFTKCGSYNFVSAQQTITAAGALTLAHGLGIIPLRTWIILVNTTGEGNYIAGNMVAYYPSTPPGNQGASIVPDATSLNIRYGSAANTFTVNNRTTGAALNITNANWNAIFVADES